MIGPMGSSGVTEREGSERLKGLDDVFVIDAVVRGYNFAPENQKHPLARQLADLLYHGVHVGFSPRGEAKWTLDYERFVRGNDPDLLSNALFTESQTDACIYHEVPVYGICEDGGSPRWVGKEMRDKHRGRALIYGATSPWQEGALEQVDRLVEEDGVVGLKPYPMDIIDGEIKSFRTDDPEVAFPIFERALQKGLRSGSGPRFDREEAQETLRAGRASTVFATTMRRLIRIQSSIGESEINTVTSWKSSE